MKIVYCLQSTYYSGGMERIVICKANYLNRLGYNIVIVTTNQKNRSSFYPIDENIRCIDLGINYDEIKNIPFAQKLFKRKEKLNRHRKELEKLLIKESPDVTISTFGYEISFLHKIKTGGKKIAEIHFSRYYRLQLDQKGIWKLANLWLTYKFKQNVKKYDAFVCLTKEDSINWKGIKHLYIIPNFINSRSAIPASLNSNIVISAGRLSQQKGYDRLLNAWKIVCQKHPEWRLEIYGSGEQKNNLINIINKLGIESTVSINNPVKDIYERFSNSSIFVLSSRYEGLPMVMLEAMGCGLPIVSFDCQCGPKDLLENKDAGFIVHNSDIKDFADKIILLIENETLRKNMGLSAYNESQYYLPENIIPQWVNLLESIVKTK